MTPKPLLRGVFAVIAAAIASPALAQEAVVPERALSPWGMFLGADPVVQTVMIGLVIASMATWTVWLAKAVEIAAVRRQMKLALIVLTEAESLAAVCVALPASRGAAASMAASARAELRRLTTPSLRRAEDLVAVRLDRQRIAAGRVLARGTGILATIGATAPFIGLFGTVWGIMNSFVGIAQSQTTNLAVVAPGIAEALLATGTGLAAAIPAVVAYNVLNRSIASVKVLLGDAVAEIRRLAAHDLDLHAPTALAAAAE